MKCAKELELSYFIKPQQYLHRFLSNSRSASFLFNAFQSVCYHQSTAASLSEKNVPSNNPNVQGSWRAIEERAKGFQENYPSLLYVVDKLLIATILALLAGQFNQYQEAKKELAEIEDQLWLLIQQLRIAHVQPVLYWTTVVNAEDVKNYEIAYELLDKVNLKLEKLKTLPWFKSQVNLYAKELSLIRDLNKNVWRYKQRNYQKVLNIFNQNVMPVLASTKHHPLADSLLAHMLLLPAGYNAKAKLEVCLAGMRASPQSGEDLTVLYNSKAFY